MPRDPTSLTPRAARRGAAPPVAAAARQAQAEAAAQTAELAAIFESMVDGVVVYDAAGRMIRVNAAARNLFDLQGIADFTEQTMDTRVALISPRDPQGVPLLHEAMPLARVLRGEPLSGVDALEFVVRLPDGQVKHLQATGAPVRDAAGTITGAVVTYRDVTEQQCLEQELAEQASQLETILETMADGLTVFDAEGRLLRTNSAIRALTASDAHGDFLSLPAAERAQRVRARHPDGRPMLPEEWPVARLLRGEIGPASAPMDIVITNLAGSELTESVSAAPIRDASGQIVGGVALYRDVTEQRRLERERTEVLGLVAHDLTNPLAAVKTQVQGLQRRLGRGEPLSAEALDAAGRAIGRMERLVGDLRMAESLEGGHFALELAPCDLIALCREAAEAARIAGGRQVTLVLPEESVLATADRDRIGQVLANLLFNALKYSPADRPVELLLATENVVSEPAADGGHAPALAARIAVRDAGPGIPPEVMPQLFQRFYRVPGIEVQHGPSGGLGLGLSIARELVERHGGRCGVESVVGTGSTFWFTLPLTAGQRRSWSDGMLNDTSVSEAGG